jgi:hypothetical protein
LRWLSLTNIRRPAFVGVAGAFRAICRPFSANLRKGPQSINEREAHELVAHVWIETSIRANERSFARSPENISSGEAASIAQADRSASIPIAATTTSVRA